MVRGNLPAALASAVFLGLLGVCIDVPGLGEVARQVLGGEGGAVREAGVITVVELVRFTHCWRGS